MIYSSTSPALADQTSTKSLPNPGWQRFSIPALTCVMLIAAMPFQAHAAWLLEPVVGTYVEHETNPRMRRDDEDEATALVVSLSLPMSYETQRTQVQFRPRTIQSFYSDNDDDDLELDNWYLPLTYLHKLNLSQIGLGLNYSDQNVRTSEQESTDPNRPGDLLEQPAGASHCQVRQALH
jgi:hypothetical protein